MVLRAAGLPYYIDMFDALGDKLHDSLRKLSGQSMITEKNVREAMEEVRVSLLEADVNYNVVKDFTANVMEKALGTDVMRHLSPAQQLIKIVHEELTELLGGEHEELKINRAPPAPIMLVGLHGSGKTTTSAKLAYYLKNQKKVPYLVPADVYRPAAIEQLQTLAASIDVAVHESTTDEDPVDIARKAHQKAEIEGADVLIIDTAGRLHIDEELIDELKRIKKAVNPCEILFIADAMTGQDAVTVAQGFNEALGLTGVILTKMEGDARGGAALSIKSVTGQPIKFVGVGEKMDALEAFHPERVAGRILGMGDLLSFMEKAQSVIDEKKAILMEERLRKDQFNMEDFLMALQQMKKMGPIENLVSMVPGMKKLTKGIRDFSPAEEELKRIESVISSMTTKERQNHAILNGSRRKRIAAGSGTTVQDVNRVIKSYMEMKKMMNRMKKMGMRGLMSGLMQSP